MAGVFFTDVCWCPKTHELLTVQRCITWKEKRVFWAQNVNNSSFLKGAFCSALAV